MQISKSCNETLVKWDVLDLFKLIRCIFVFKSVTENLCFLGEITVYALRDRTQHGHVKSSFRGQIGCLQTHDSDDARNAAGGQEVIFLHRNQ